MVEVRFVVAVCLWSVEDVRSQLAEGSSIEEITNSYKPGFLFVGQRQTV